MLGRPAEAQMIFRFPAAIRDMTNAPALVAFARQMRRIREKGCP